MIIGTAGHVDHGKTTLVRALTGVNTDRLPDEQRRGITIDLGFAPLQLDDGRVASIVDVPGHESLVHTMIAGAAGIRVALVVVAADEGVMPQTREHLRVLTALGVDRAVVALSRADLADTTRLAAVARDVCDLLRISSLRADEPIAVSIVDGRGVAEVRAALVRCVTSLPPRDADDLFRCFVDRAFVVKGTGTVVTGTIASGSITTGERVTILPGARTTRVRAIEAHGRAIADARAGTRAALALTDVTPAELSRGTVLVTSDAWSCSTRLTARIVLAGHRVLSRRCMLHLGGAAAIARVVPLAQPAANTPVVAQITVDRPLVARRGDRFVLRSTDPSDTIGGGVVLDSAPERGTRSAIEGAAAAPADALSAMLAAARGAGLSRDELPVRLGMPPARVASVMEQSGAVVIGRRVLSRDAYDALIAALERRVREWCDANPLGEGMPLAELRSELRATMRAADDTVASVLRDAIQRGALASRGGMVATTERLSLPAADAALLARLLHRVRQSGREPPNVAELSAELGPSVPELLTFAARRGNLVRVESVRYYAAEVITELEAHVRRNLQPGRAYQPSELRAIVGVSRKYLIPLLEYLDSVGVTVRNSGGRTLRTVSSA